jgi:hypothetical protein
VEVRTFLIQDQTGPVVDLTGEVGAVVSQAPRPLRSGDFASTVDRWMNEINALITGAVGSDKWVSVGYAVPRGGTTGALQIDRLVCHEVLFDLRVSWTQAQRHHRYDITYSSQGSTLRDPDTGSGASIPPFDPATSNKCHPEEPPVELCRRVDAELDFRHEELLPAVLVAAPSGNDPIVAFLWEVQDGVPALAEGDVARFDFDPVEPVDKHVRLTGYTERGCSVVVERSINLRG